MNRMFHMVTKTWNPVIGCRFYCRYCWARRLAEGRLKKTTRKYREGFKPKFCEDELNARFQPNEFVFVSDMADMFGNWVPKEWILKVLNVIKRHPRTTFLFLTKNPSRYLELQNVLVEYDNVILGATIETNDNQLYRIHKISRAPLPLKRIIAMMLLDHPRKMISVEPILDFKPSFWERIVVAEPEFVYVGYDNYNNRLPEPPLDKTLELIDILRQHGIVVYTKTMRKAWYEEGGK